MNNETSRYELFKAEAAQDIDHYRKKVKGDGSFEYVEQVKQLKRLSNRMSAPMMIYLFGEQLGEHLFEKLIIDCRRDFLYFLGTLDSQILFYLLYELKNNEQLFFYE
jgi:hypothetical protein